MKNIKVFISAIPLAFLFIACSGKVQTNKIPNETKYYLPKGAKTSDKVALDSKELQSYSLTLEEFFKRNVKADEEKKQDIYQTGIKRGYFQ
ncbi:hypothetical protein [Helicobacter fennelliae]|uniref:Lipoprotein n=1 Tax=Helicobacter fennelliae MRY12-0050 TaxID=1325130 RepID=T1CM87_9HELI|nr:hypothetical protein [Helicobacter fennelliae]GAD17834.1 hypothetical protein HFN_0649 [Helicobacter fennelliae MRY12-0050]STP07372.1 Uncharacterised protein [Helicobacter fennelliae]